MTIETLRFPPDVNETVFLRDYWQTRPLLMRGAMPGFAPPIDPDELAGLACEAEVESRLVLEKDGIRPWEARPGPFDEDDFAALPDSHWTLLVQDVDKHVPEVAALLEPFRFIPDWRVDDIMISYAPDQGSVGPHVDDYDVFLLQAHGRRRWRIHTRPLDENDYIPGLDLRILPHFEAEQDWVLEPGDILYLPPNVAHWGVAEGDCMTYSVGFRAPELRDLTRTLSEVWVQRRIPTGRYRDPKLSPQSASGEILPEVFEHLGRTMGDLPFAADPLFRVWVGRYLTETKDNLALDPPSAPLERDQFAVALDRHGGLTRSGYARMAFCRGENGQHLLFVNGGDYALSSGHGELLRVLTGERWLDREDLSPWLRDAECLDLLCRLYNDGCFEFPDD